MATGDSRDAPLIGSCPAVAHVDQEQQTRP